MSKEEEDLNQNRIQDGARTSKYLKLLGLYDEWFLDFMKLLVFLNNGFDRETTNQANTKTQNGVLMILPVFCC